MKKNMKNKTMNKFQFYFMVFSWVFQRVVGCPEMFMAMKTSILMGFSGFFPWGFHGLPTMKNL
jgi:hypothetical protein